MDLKKPNKLVENFLQSLYTDNRSQAKEWRGTNIPVGDDSNRPNLVRECMTMEGKRQKINCLRKLRDQAAMNPQYQTRMDRFVDAVSGNYEPTDHQGTIPGNEFKETAVGEDLTEGVIGKTKDHIKHAPDIVKNIKMVQFLSLDMGYSKGYNLKFCKDISAGKERKQCLLKNQVVSLKGKIRALEDYRAGRGKAGKRFSGGCKHMDENRKAVCKRTVRWAIKGIQRKLNPLLRKYRP